MRTLQILRNAEVGVFRGALKLLEAPGFVVVRINGSHHRLKHPDGRVTAVPVHKNQYLPKGLLRKIIREDLELELDTLIDLWNKYK